MLFVLNDMPDIKKRTLLEQLYLEYSTEMFYVALDVLHDRELAEDAVHTAFLNLAKNTLKINDAFSKKTKGFLRVVVKNAAVDMLRKMNPQISSIDNESIQVIDNKPLPLDIIINNETIDELQNSLAMLDPKYVDVLLLKYYNNNSVADIAKLVGVSIETVRTRMRRAKKMLAESIIEGDTDYAQAKKRQ